MATTVDLPIQSNGAADEPARREQAAKVAVEELTGLAIQERALTTLLKRQAAETPDGPNRDRLGAHVEESERHAELFAEQADRLGRHRGARETGAAVVRSGLAAVGAIGATIGQLATAPLALAVSGGRAERQLENAGVEGAALANKLVILHAVAEASRLSGRSETATALAEARDEAQGTWDDLLEQTPQLMRDLVATRG